MSERAKYTMYGVDRAGTPWDYLIDSPQEVLAKLASERAANPRNTYGVYLTDDPEHGDVEDQIMEELDR